MMMMMVMMMVMMMMVMMMMMIGTTRAHRLMSQRSREVSTGSTVENLGSSSSLRSV